MMRPEPVVSQGTRAIAQGAGASGQARRPRWSVTTRVVGALRWLVVAVLVGAAARKLFDVAAFEDILWEMGFFPAPLIQPLAWLIPASEIAAAVCLAIPRTQFLGACLAMSLSAAFAGLHAYVYVNGLVVRCGCAGLREEATGGLYHLLLATVCGAMFAGAFTLAACPARGGALRQEGCEQPNS